MAKSIIDIKQDVADSKIINVNTLVPENQKGSTKKRPVLENVKTYLIAKKAVPYKDVTTVAQLRMKVEQLEDIIMELAEYINWKR